MKPVSQVLSGWGNYPRQLCFTFGAGSRQEMRQALAAGGQSSYIARGLGRAYGDSALNRESGVLLQTGLNRLLAFDATTGVLECEAGVSFAEIIDYFLPKGWFLPTTPGTKFITVGGAIAADVHGKNHHQVGSFGRFVLDFRLLLADNSEIICSPTQNSDVFWATIGGMGLTGCIVSARFQLVRVNTAFVTVNYRRTSNLDEMLAVFSAEDHKFQYSVAWIDCLAQGSSLGRSVMMLANNASIEDLPHRYQQDPLASLKRRSLRVPWNCPNMVIAPWSMRVFNSLYYAAHGDRIAPADFDSFFYPLDRIAQWNRIYGRRGFVQYQAWFPQESSRIGLVELLERITSTQRASFLAVLKRSGEGDKGLLSYLQPGYTLALDFPNTGLDLQEMCSDLDRILLRHGGRLYLAKDATTTAECFREMYPRLPEFRSIKATIDPAGRFQSSQAHRLKIV